MHPTVVVKDRTEQAADCLDSYLHDRARHGGFLSLGKPALELLHWADPALHSWYTATSITEAQCTHFKAPNESRLGLPNASIIASFSSPLEPSAVQRIMGLST